MDSWVLCPVLVNAGGGACKGRESLEKNTCKRGRAVLPPPPLELSFLKETSRGCTHCLRVVVDTALLSRCQAAQQQLRLAVPLVGPSWWPLHPFISSAGVLWAAAGSSIIALLLLPSAVRDSSGRSLRRESGRGEDPLQTLSARLPASAPAGTDPARLEASTALPCCRPGWAPRPPCCLWSCAVDSLLLIESWEGTLWR